MAHEEEKLNQKERLVLKKFLSELKIAKRKTKKPIIIAMVGLVGSGKNFIAREFAAAIGASIIANDVIRVELRKQNQNYNHVQKIAEDMATEIISHSGNVVFDSDYINQKKCIRLRKKAKSLGVQLLFIRTHCDMDISLGRILSSKYDSVSFFSGASSRWHGSKQSVGAVVKIREMWRRTPHHYRWSNRDGGTWILKKSPLTLFADINTTVPKLWKKGIKESIKKISIL